MDTQAGYLHGTLENTNSWIQYFWTLDISHIMTIPIITQATQNLDNPACLAEHKI